MKKQNQNHTLKKKNKFFGFKKKNTMYDLKKKQIKSKETKTQFLFFLRENLKHKTIHFFF